MSIRNKTLFGLITAGLLVAGVAWAADVPGTTVSDQTVIPVEGAGMVTVELAPAGLSLVEAVPEAGWTVTVETSVGREVESRFDSNDTRVDFSAELEDGNINVEIERRVAAPSGSSSTTITSTSVTAPSTTSSTVDRPTSTTTDDGGSTSTSIDDDGGSTSTTVDDDGGATSTTIDDDGGSTSTTIDDGGSTSTTINDDTIDLPDGPRTFTVGAAGSITVNIQSGRLALTAVIVASGWSYEIDKSESDDIRVEFEKGDDSEAEIRVRINDGSLEVEIDTD
jgi:hypothetical protein